MATPTFRSRGALVLVSVLVGVVMAVGGYLLLSGSGSGEATSAANPGTSLQRDEPGGRDTPGGPTPPADRQPAEQDPATSSIPAPDGVPTATPVEPTSSSADPTTTTDDSTSAPAPTTTQESTPQSTGPSEPSSSAPPPTTTSATESDDDLLGELLRYVNEERTAAGCPAATTDAALTGSAQAHSDDMSENRSLSHESSDGTSFEERVESHGYGDPAAENLAMGVASARAVVDNWMAQPAHNANITDCDVVAMGAGLNQDGWYWTLDLGY